MEILILLGIAVVAIFACYWVTVGAFRLLNRVLCLPKYQDVIVPSKYNFKTACPRAKPTRCRGETPNKIVRLIRGRFSRLSTGKRDGVVAGETDDA